MQKEVKQNELCKVFDPCELYDLPKHWDIEYLLDRYHKVHFDVYMGLIFGCILHMRPVLILQCFISIGGIILQELVNTDAFKRVKVIVVIDVSYLAVGKLLHCIWLKHDKIALSTNLTSVDVC